MSQISHPDHYTWHPTGIECKDINQHLCANLAAAFKYVYRHQKKGKPIQDIQKAVQHLRFESHALFVAMTTGTGGRDLVQSNYRRLVAEGITSMIESELDGGAFGEPRIAAFLRHLQNSLWAQKLSTQIRHITHAAGALDFYIGDLVALQAAQIESTEHHPV